jgi:hypothetical protein
MSSCSELALFGLRYSQAKKFIPGQSLSQQLLARTHSRGKDNREDGYRSILAPEPEIDPCGWQQYAIAFNASDSPFTPQF